MGTRREARERAVQFLFQHDLNPPTDLDAALGRFWESQRAAALQAETTGATWGQPPALPPPSAKESVVRLFADPLIRGTLEHRDEIDAHIRRIAKNWELHRIAVVDRNILRLATFELMEVLETPMKVVLNEAIELSKRFGTEDSGAFVNGVLDKVGSLLRPQQKPEVRGGA